MGALWNPRAVTRTGSPGRARGGWSTNRGGASSARAEGRTRANSRRDRSRGKRLGTDEICGARGGDVNEPPLGQVPPGRERPVVRAHRWKQNRGLLVSQEGSQAGRASCASSFPPGGRLPSFRYPFSEGIFRAFSEGEIPDAAHFSLRTFHRCQVHPESWSSPSGQAAPVRETGVGAPYRQAVALWEEPRGDRGALPRAGHERPARGAGGTVSQRAAQAPPAPPGPAPYHPSPHPRAPPPPP